MSTQAIEIQSHGQLQPQTDWHSADQVLKRVRAIQQLMEAVMKKDTHFGVIPGTKKPTLYKAGSEQILSMFRIAIDPIIEDISSEDECRYRVLCRLADASGRFLGAGVGECSSSEQKYKWRSVVSKAEWEHFQKNYPERTRLKFTAYYKDGKRIEKQEEQVRAEVADIRNTILKMAKKRAQIDATLTVTGCSDMFEQDLEDLPEEIIPHIEEPSQPEPVKKTTAKPPATVPTQQTAPSSPQGQSPAGDVVTEKQLKMLFAIQKSANVSDDKLKEYLAPKGITSRKDIPKAIFQEVIDWLDPNYQFHTRPNQTEDF